MTDIIAKLQPSLGRRWFGVVSLGIVALIASYIFWVSPPVSILGKLGLLALIAALIWQAQWNLRVTKTGLILTEEGIYDDQGTCICRLDNIQDIDAGLFAFKPSNGFLLRLVEKDKPAWAPGLYWRFERRLGVGGATKSAQAKAMADTITMMVHERAMGPDLS